MSCGGLSFSVVVASRGRPDWLRRCLTALRQLDHPAFEIVVVSDAEGLAVVPPDLAKTVPFDRPNLSAARNAGIRAAAGDVCAFIDDDAVPEPLWLRHFEAALGGTGAAAAVGYVRGRNGIGFQSRAASVGRDAGTRDVDHKGDAPGIPRLPEGRALKLVGTNAAVRRDVLAAAGGFDPAFAWYLEDADLSLRLAGAGHALAVAPLAEVHHGFAPSVRRAADRMPRDLYDIGRSSAVFLRRHPGADPAGIRAALAAEQRARLLRHMVRGACEPGDVGRLLAGLDAGWRDGEGVPLAPLAPLASDPAPFRRVRPIPPGHHVIGCRLGRRRRRLAEAETLVRSGCRVSLFSFSLTIVRHRLSYTVSGVWVQTGGQFGPGDRSGRRIRWCRFIDRLKEEIGRVAKIRGIAQSTRG